MKAPLFCLFIWALLSSAALAANKAENVIPADAAKALQSATSGTLYSLEPWVRPRLWDGKLYRFKVLGKMRLDAEREGRVAETFRKAVSDWDGMAAACFDPRHALKVVSGGHVYDFLLCYNCQQMEVYRDETRIAGLGAMGSPTFLNDLLATAHVPLSKTDTEEERSVEATKEAQAKARWLAVLPKALVPYRAKLEGLPRDVSQARVALAKAYPDQPKRILTLLAWLGSSEVSWSGYRDAPELLLLDYPTPTILKAMQAAPLTSEQIVGAARFFAGWTFSQERPGDLKLLPKSIKRELLTHSLMSKDKYERARAKQAFR